jgi:signal transduction histidine kinase
VRRVAIVAADLTARGDTDGRWELGAEAHELGADRAEIAGARAGRAVASPLFTGHDGLPYKRGYAPIAAPPALASSPPGGGEPAGFAVVEASADYLLALASFRRWLLSASALTVAGVAIVILLIARRITGPVVRLAGAAERIGQGQLATAVPVETRDELGFLAATLDEMRAALQARDERLQMMLAGIAHEVRNPLGGLELYAGLLRDALAGAPERLQEVARIEAAAGAGRRAAPAAAGRGARPGAGGRRRGHRRRDPGGHPRWRGRRARRPGPAATRAAQPGAQRGHRDRGRRWNRRRCAPPGRPGRAPGRRW